MVSLESELYLMSCVRERLLRSVTHLDNDEQYEVLRNHDEYCALVDPVVNNSRQTELDWSCLFYTKLTNGLQGKICTAGYYLCRKARTLSSSVTCIPSFSTCSSWKRRMPAWS
jgi:hypothetical protein